MALMGWGKKSRPETPPQHGTASQQDEAQKSLRQVVCLHGNCCLWGYLLFQEFTFLKGNGHLYLLFQEFKGEWPRFATSCPRAVLYVTAPQALKHSYGAQHPGSEGRSRFSFFRYLLSHLRLWFYHMETLFLPGNFWFRHALRQPALESLLVLSSYGNSQRMLMIWKAKFHTGWGILTTILLQSRINVSLLN